MIVYLHGLNSSAQSTKARQLGEAMATLGRSGQYLSPSLPHRPAEAMALVVSLLKGDAGDSSNGAPSALHNPVCFVGSSLGGFYATYLAEKFDARAVLINPAVSAHQGLRAYLGPQTNLYSGDRYDLGEDHMRELQAIHVPAIDPSRYLLIVETGDEVLDYRLAVEYYRGAEHRVIQGGDHSLRSFARHIPRILAFAAGQ